MLTLRSTATMSSGYAIPLLGFGVYKNDDNVTCFKSVTEALRVGYRHIDTAQMYANEMAVGLAVKQSGVPREEIFITTKIEHKDYGYERTLQAVEESLERLGLEYIDLLLLHEPYGGPASRLEAYRALSVAKECGKIRTIGVSNLSEKHIEMLSAAGLEVPAQKELIAFCRAQSILVTAFCPLVRGERNNNNAIQYLVKKYDKSPAQIFVRWALQKGVIPLPKSATASRIMENADVFSEGYVLSAEDMRMMDYLDEGKAGSISWWPYTEE
ncbi:Aldo/keto reductase [Mycena metata]|uniref:Aldo/keto reductase n=1 Tax=Mycena metata TaxID=1033252 RepID=A0AAD7H268_9AGAR|nr:Aldo/keto reductase [Mycena metata]